MHLYLFADQLVIKSKNNRKNCMHGTRKSKDNELVEGRPVQTLSEMNVKQWFLLKKRL